DDLLAMVLAEVEGLLRALGLARQVRVLACDTAVAPAQRVTSARQVQLVGGGGTDMGRGIEGDAGRGRAARRAGAAAARVGARRPDRARLSWPSDGRSAAPGRPGG